jgi:hypothetical protein
MIATMKKNQRPIRRIISLEEAFLYPKLRELYDPSYLNLINLVKDRLMDVGPQRISRMDASGIDLQVLSMSPLACKLSNSNKLLV